MKIFRYFIIIFIFLNTPIKASLNENIINQLKEGGKLIFIRHAYAPGSGDPNNFDLKDCSTQRNLNKEGRLQSKKIGYYFKKNKIPIQKVISSEWCRCKETAQILDLGAVTELPILNSFFENFHLKDNQTTQLKDWLSQHNNKTSIILVTHQVNITALTGVYPSSGEIVVIRMTNLGGVKVVGRIPPD